MTQKVNIKINTEGAKRAKDELGGVNGAISKMGKTVGIATAAYFGARGLINAFSTTIKLAGEQEQAEKRLETALGRTSQELLNQASALQKVTTFGDEAIIGVQASIAAFTDSEEQIKKATEATLDIATAMGMDLKAAGDLVAKTLGSSTNAMSRYGIAVEGAVGSNERLESLTENVANLFGGQAKAQAETMAGALDQAQNSAGDLAEAIGGKLSPLVKVIATDFTAVAEELTKFINPETLSREEQLNNLLRERNLLHNEEKGAIEEAINVSDLWNSGYIERNQVSEIALTTSKEALDAEIAKYDELLFKQQKDLDIKRSSIDAEIEFGAVIETVADKSNVAYQELIGTKNKLLQQDLKNAALSGQSASEAMRSVVRSEVMEAVAGYISSILRTMPFPLNIGLAAGGGALVAGLVDSQLSKIPKFADGGIVPGVGNSDTVPAMLTPGELILNQAQQESLAKNSNKITLNISAPLVDETIVDTIIPAIQKAQKMNLA